MSGEEKAPVVERLSATDAPAIVSVFCDAFHDYSVMRHVVGDMGDSYDTLLEALIGFFVSARVFRNEPLIGIRDGSGGLSAAAILTPPGDREAPSELFELRERVWEELGTDARSRYENLGSVWQNFSVEEPDLHLNMIGVRGEFAGTGLGKTLMDFVHSMSVEDPESTGVTLTTETPGNVPFYQKFGYEIVGHIVVNDEVETWGFFRPDRI